MSTGATGEHRRCGDDERDRKEGRQKEAVKLHVAYIGAIPLGLNRISP
jgi:hypothetical protein